MRVALASGSQRRRDILTLAGLSFDLCVSEGGVVEVVASEEPDAKRLTLRNARLKLQSAVAGMGESGTTNAVIIAADTTVTIDEQSMGKPTDRLEAIAMLKQLRGRWHQVVTSVAVGLNLCDRPEDTRTRSVVSDVRMRNYEDDEIERYVASGVPYDRAGAYGVQDTEFNPAESVLGCYLNVVGLPLCALRELLPPSVTTFADTHIYVTCAAHERGEEA